MHELFSSEPIRPPARRGERTVPMRRAPATESWPPPDRDPADVAVVAARLLSASGRIGSRLHATAREHQVDPYLLRLLLLFAESNQPLRIGNVAELLAVSHATASRAAKRAQAAGLVDKFASSIDGREVIVRLTHSGRAAVTRCLDALRADAAEVLGLGKTAKIHPRGADLSALLGPPPYLRRTSENAGWRAGVRAGMPDE
jgi:DNA-binding MarR family transcriptional regulator